MGKKDIVVGHAAIEDFFYWINERHRIWKVRNAGAPRPWTDDPILLDWKFTNVFRELDRGTIALREMLAPVWHEDPALTAFNIVWYRLLNREEHARDFGFITDIDDLVLKMQDKASAEEPLFTSAHLTVGIGGEAKVDTYIRTFRRFWRERAKLVEFCIPKTLEDAFEFLQGYECVGPFISYEIVSDFRHYGNLLGDCYDAESWANVGPGCRRGLLRLGLPVDLKSLVWLWNLAYDAGAVATIDGHEYRWDSAVSAGGSVPCGLAEHVVEHHPAQRRFNSEPLRFPLFEMREIEHSLCEFDKYQRVKTGVGRPRQTYNGRHR